MRGALRWTKGLSLCVLAVSGNACGWGSPLPEASAPATREAVRSVDHQGLEAVRRHLEAREYQISGSGHDLQAPNRAQNLRTYFEPDGIRLHDRTAPGSPELLLLSLVGVGRGSVEADVPPGEVVVVGPNHVEIRRPGLTEWYENSAAGLEQGFTLESRSPGKGPLAVEIALRGALASLQGEAVVFESGPPRRKLRYGELAVVDARDQRLSAHLEVSGSGTRVRIVVDDRGAEYPIVIDPLLTALPDAMVESNQLTAHLGFSVAHAGDVDGDGFADVIVGVPNYDAGQADEGIAIIVYGSPTGPASGGIPAAGAVIESNQVSSHLGYSVAGAGDVNGDGYDDVIVGAWQYDAGQTDEGAAFVVLGGPFALGIKHPAAPGVTRLESDQADAYLGWSVAGAGDVDGDGYDDVIVGAWSYDSGQFDEGTAFVFHGGPSGVPNGTPATAAARLESDRALANLGWSVASAGDVNGDGYGDVIVGAPSYNLAPVVGGAAFVVLGSVTGIPSGGPAAADTVLASYVNGGDGFGGSVAGVGDVDGDGYGDVIVGAAGFENGQFNEGAAFLFHGGASGIPDGITSTADGVLEADQPGAEMGASVARAGDVNGDGYGDVIVGAPWYDHPESTEGAAFVFLGSATGVGYGNPTTAFAAVESNQADARFGTSVGGGGDVDGDGHADVIVGSHLFDAGLFDEGAAFVYRGSPSGLIDGDPGSAGTRLSVSQMNAFFGYQVAGAGDVNGDGYDDVIVAAPNFDAGVYGEGAAFVFKGGADGIADATPATAATQLVTDMPGVGLGTGVGAAGDVNGDGYADVVVSSYVYPAAPDRIGAAFVYHGAPSGFADGNVVSPSAKFESDQMSIFFGASVSGAGDVNGDGYGDLLVADLTYEDGQDSEGAVFVLMGGPAGIPSGNSASPGVVHLESNLVGAFFGYAASAAGDVNGDGYSDVIIGAAGAAFVFLGSANGITSLDVQAPDVAWIQADVSGSCFGCTVAGAGDVDGDGYDDVIVGSESELNAMNVQAGAAFVVHGGPGGIADSTPSTPGVTKLESDQEDSDFGLSVASAGDVNGDGFADVIVGARSYESGPTKGGAAFVFHGSPIGIPSGGPSIAATQLSSDEDNAYFGASVGGAGDVDGDGYADTIVGAMLYPFMAGPDSVPGGAAFVFRGNGGVSARTISLRQARGDGSELPVQPGGGVPADLGFVASLVASHPDGTGRVQAEFEACPSGVPFEDAACTTATSPGWVEVDGATPTAMLSHTFANLTADTLYRWRARALYASATGAIPASPAHGAWRRPGGQKITGDVRAVPEPGLLVSLGVGGVGLVALARRRAARTGRRGAQRRSATS